VIKACGCLSDRFVTRNRDVLHPSDQTSLILALVVEYMQVIRLSRVD
jgi:hypothetical protein